MVVLERRFPGDAAILAWRCGAQNLNLNMRTRGAGPLTSDKPNWSLQATRPVDMFKIDEEARVKWNAIVVDARKGEKLEPRNGFWWWLETMALLGARRDEEVWPVLRVGSSKQEFRDYTKEKLVVLRRAHIKVQGTVPVAFLVQGSSFFYYSRWREVTRQVCENVMGARLMGRHKTALEGGRDMVMMGRLLRRSDDTISVLVANAVEAIALRSALPPSAAMLKPLTSGASTIAIAGHPGSLIRYANELKRKDIALQLTNEMNDFARARRASSAQLKAALTSGNSLVDQLKDATISWAAGSQNMGAMLV
ncbi:hypothetical protein EON80_31800, partial [bacterium]